MDPNNWVHCAFCNFLSFSLCLWFHTDTELDFEILAFQTQKKTKKTHLVQVYQYVPYVPGKIGNNVVDDCRREKIWSAKKFPP